MFSLIYTATTVLLNRVRGAGQYPKVITYVLLGVAVAVITGDYLMGLTTLLGTWLWAAPGWGRYFTAQTGWVTPLKEREIWGIDELADSGARLLVGNTYIDEKFARASGVIGMSLRGLIFSLPMFIGLTYLSGTGYYIYMILQGPAYYLTKTIKDAELLTGAVLGLGIAHSCGMFN